MRRRLLLASGLFHLSLSQITVDQPDFSEELRGWLDHVENFPLHLEQVARAAGDRTYRFDTRFFNQKADHINKQHHDTFRQRYFVYDKFSREEQNFPLFVFCGAEQGDVYKEWDRFGFMVEFAREQGAKVIWLEHRFFGESMPFGAKSFEVRADRVGLLSLEQAMADYVKIIEIEHGEGPVMTFGGSLSGTIAMLMRVRYPSLVNLAFASSAPVIGVPGVADPNAWRKVVTENFGQFGGADCPEMIRAGFDAMRRRDEAKLHAAFNPCEAQASSQHWDHIFGRLWSYLDMLGTFVYPEGTKSITPLCSYMRGGSNATTRPSGEVAFARLLRAQMGAYTDTCLNFTKMVTPAKNAGPWGLGWGYMACTEVVHPIGSNGRTDMFPKHEWTVASLRYHCKRNWNVEPDPQYMIRALGLKVKGVGAEAKVERNPSVPGRVLLSWGEFDPWSTMVPKNGWRDDVAIVKVPGGSHCSDLETASEKDTEDMRQARADIKRTLAGWIREIRPVRRMDVHEFGESSSLRGFGSKANTSNGSEYVGWKIDKEVKKIDKEVKKIDASVDQAGNALRKVAVKKL